MRHLWSVVCVRAILDKYTNRISLLEILDEFALDPGQVVPETLEERGALPIHLEVATQWERTDYGTPESGTCFLEVYSPNGELTGSGKLAVDLVAAPRSRVILRFDAFRLAGLGKYRFVISKEEEGQSGREPVTEVPLYVKWDESASAEEPTAIDHPKKKRKAPLKKS
jgi:hypothetical protein